MNPGILLVCDPHSRRAQADVTGMLDGLGVSPTDDVVAARGRGWAAAALAPPAAEPTCGADVYAEAGDILIWAGEMLIPPTWTAGLPARSSRQTIGAAVLRRIRALGVEALGEVDGAFCGAWYDHTRRRWMVFNDRLGLLPVFWSALDDRLVVSHKAWLTWKASGDVLDISDFGVVDLLRSGNMVDDHTLIEGVHWLKGGHVVYWGEEGCGSYGYWDFHPRRPAAADENEALEHYTAILEQALRRHTAGEAPLLLGISGGTDSRTFLAMCHALGRVPACFTAGWAFGDDVRFGRRLARAAGAVHEWAPLDEDLLPDRLTEAIIETDGLHSVAHLAPATAMRAHLQGHAGAVLLEGYMQGVTSGSYVPADDDAAWNVPPHEQPWARRHLHAGGGVEQINALLRPELALESYRRWKVQVNDRYRRAPVDDPVQRAEYTVVSGRSGRIDVLGTNLLRRDVLVRCPACDRDVLEWFSSTPPRWRRGKRLALEILRRRFPPLARVPRTSSDGLPIAGDRWLREYCWQREKLHRWWVGLRHPWARRWGTGGLAIRAWTFETWRKTGQLDVLTSPGARVLQWVERDALNGLWNDAVRDPLEAGPLLGLATIEIMVRRLEDLARTPWSARAERVRFRVVNPAAPRSPAAPEQSDVTLSGGPR